MPKENNLLDKKNVVYESKFFFVTKYKKDKKKTYNFNVFTKDSFCLGEIKWFSNWRKYCFFPNNDTVWDGDCLRDIWLFLIRINDEHKHNLERRDTNDNSNTTNN